MNLARAVLILLIGVLMITVLWVAPEQMHLMGKPACVGPNGAFARIDGQPVTESSGSCAASTSFTYPKTVTLITGETLKLTDNILPSDYIYDRISYANIQRTAIGKIFANSDIQLIITVILVLLLFVAMYNEYCIYQRGQNE